MSADKNDQVLSKKRGLLQRLQENYRRLKAYHALATHDIGELEKDGDTWAREGRVSRRAHARRLGEREAKRRRRGSFESPFETETGQTATDLLDRKIASYRNRIRRTSVQILVAATAGYQHRETSLAARQGGLITDSDSNNDFGDGNGGDDDDDGGAMVKMAMAMLIRPTHAEPPLLGENLMASEKASSRPYGPADEEPDIYNPRLWNWLYDIDVEWLKDDVTRTKFKNHPDNAPLGRMTWKQQEKTFPVLNSIFKMRRKDESELWNPMTRVHEEMNLSERPPLEADINTLLSLERQRGFERREFNPMYYEYSRVPLDLPAKLSDEEMRRGPLPAPPRLPLMSNAGRQVNLGREPTPPFESDRDERRWNFLNMVDENPLPIAQYHYPIDSPAVSTFKFNDGRQVSDILKPGPLDELRQVRGSQEIVDYGKQVESETAHLKEPYHSGVVSERPPPGFRPGDPGTKMTEAERKRFINARKELERRAKEELSRAIRRENAARRRAAKETVGTPPFRNDKFSAQMGNLDGKMDVWEQYYEAQKENPFWHFEDVNDSESHLHNDIKKTGSG
ncbi:uncharacterized protein F4807DRAFT_249417 [Annulohypoxylon truncatum]|uniref:uncharacterized protein n=1 Tax=Annulohypoxylon truncatum TaxID=327061 RepID=UPI0020074FE8|nr:uncharacterized protein F4807DRAFT_249417 [Annulohypoxylon truncatum]KAI1205982.1 hypothetical protein F4807DRAFT_249417 [Annulohypoxylon truncatum]